MKLLQVHFGKEGGAERFFVALSQGFQRHGIEQRFIVRPDRTWSDEIKALGDVTEGNYSHLMAATGIMQRRMRKICHTWQPDAILAWMPRAARLLPSASTTKALRLTRLGDFPKSLRYFNNTDVVIGNLPGIVKRTQDLGWAGASTMISNFPRPVAPVAVERRQHSTPDDAFLVVTGGRFVQRKGMDIALRAVAKTPNAWLWLLGDGPEMEPLKALASELQIEDRVRFLGWVPEAIHHIAAGDAFIMPSRHEPLGNMLLEAWRAGVPSISTRSEGPDWYMRADIDGALVEIDDVDGVANALAYIRSHPQEAVKWAENANQRLEEMFSEKAVVEAYVRLIEQGSAKFR